MARIAVPTLPLFAPLPEVAIPGIQANNQASTALRQALKEASDLCSDLVHLRKSLDSVNLTKLDDQELGAFLETNRERLRDLTPNDPRFNSLQSLVSRAEETAKYRQSLAARRAELRDGTTHVENEPATVGENY